MTELETLILDALRACDGALSSTEVAAKLPPRKRPRGKNTVCQVLQALVDKGLVIHVNGHSKKYSRYKVSDAGKRPLTNIYSMWPFVPISAVKCR